MLWPSVQSDFLLSLAVEGMYRPVWSDAILEELEFHEARKLVKRGTDPDRAAEFARLLVEQMRAAFDDALVEGREGLDTTYGLPDPDDEHVVATASSGVPGRSSRTTLRTSHRTGFQPTSKCSGHRSSC